VHGNERYSRVPAITRNDASEARPRYEVHDLREQRLADIHANFSGLGNPKNIAKIGSPVQVETKWNLT